MDNKSFTPIKGHVVTEQQQIHFFNLFDFLKRNTEELLGVDYFKECRGDIVKGHGIVVKQYEVVFQFFCSQIKAVEHNISIDDIDSYIEKYQNKSSHEKPFKVRIGQDLTEDRKIMHYRLKDNKALCDKAIKAFNAHSECTRRFLDVIFMNIFMQLKD